MRRALAAGLAVTALATAPVAVGVATQPAVPAAPVVLAADEDTATEDTLARIAADMTRAEDSDNWDRRYGDGSTD